ncbi:uncharacterized protein METZ01_LOCUS400829, partial [marine metagenome]
MPTPVQRRVFFVWRLRCATLGQAIATVRNIVYFDLETMRSADDVGGWSHIDKMGMSIGVTYSTGNGGYSI